MRLQLLTTALQNPSLHHGVVSKVVLEGVGDDPFKTTPRYLFAPEWHGQNADQNLITTFVYDSAGRQIEVTDPAGGKTLMSYDKGGRLLTQTDPLGSITAYRYDRLGRRVLVVQNWAAAGLSDPAEWRWDGTHWVDEKGTVVAHGELNDRNLPVQVEFDKGGRMLTLRDPRGNRSTYTYDLLDRRRSLTDPLNQRWETAYFNLNGTTRTEHTNPLQQVTRHDTDEAGRLKRVEYLDESPKLTPDVFFSYDKGGRRVAMDESLDLGSTWVRRTQFSHDLAGRLNQVAFDTDGDGTPEQTVSYQYEAGGLRTQLILPEGQTVSYQYDVRGQLVGVTDWEDNATAFRFDQVGRLAQSQRANGFASQYAYDVGGRLVRLSHTQDGHTLGHFEYTVDGRGNRTQALECLPRVGSGGTTLLHDDPAVQSVRGVWANVEDFRQTASLTAALRMSIFGTQISLFMGVGPDHSLFEVYVNGSLWRTVNGYAPLAGVTTLEITLSREGPHHIEVRNRNDRDLRATGHKLRFHKLESNRAYDLHTLTYYYDALSRLVNAAYHPGANPTGTPFREYAYQYDGAGNRTRETVTVSGVPTISNWTYNGVNQITSGGVTYDGAGRMTSDGTNTFTWDRADRLLSMGGLGYTYNGLGQRVGESHNGVVTSYLNDLQPGLVKLLNSDTEGDITWYLHTPMGIHQQQNPDQNWVYPVQDGLGSVRAVVDAAGQILESRLYAPYGDPYGGSGTPQTGFGFTGEQTDANGLLNLRARYYLPGLGVFPSLDPVEEGNRYGYVGGNPSNFADPSGMCWANASAADWQRRVCQAALVERYRFSSPEGRGYLADAESMEIWGQLSYTDFVSVWNTPDNLIPISSVLAGGFAAAGAQSQLIPVLPDPGDISGLLTALGTLLAAGCAAAINELVRAEPFDFASAEKRYFDWEDASKDASDAIKRIIPFASEPMILFRGTTLSKAHVLRNPLWLTPDLVSATIYAQFEGTAGRNPLMPNEVSQDTSAISIYGIARIILATLIAAGLVINRAGKQPPITGLEFGFTLPAQPSLVGPFVIAIPDSFTGR